MTCQDCARPLFRTEFPIKLCYLHWHAPLARIDRLMRLGRVGTIWR